MKAIFSAWAGLTLLTLTATAQKSTNSFAGVWKVNWEKAPEVKSVPEDYASRFKTVEQYRNFVTQRAKGLILEIRTNNTAVLRYQDGKVENYRWEISPQFPKYDIWLQMRPHRLSWASIGHGFKVSDTNTATLLFQLDWNEDFAVRVPLVMDRQRTETKSLDHQ